MSEEASQQPESGDATGAHFARLKWAVLFAVGGAALAIARVVMQSSSVEGDVAVYTSTERSFYTRDPVLGWEATEASWFWLGLELTAVVVVATVGVALLWWMAPKMARSDRAWARKASPILAIGAAIVALFTPVPGLMGMVSGLPPEGVLASIPSEAEALEGATEGSFPEGTAGTYTVVPEHSRVVAKVSAGAETFDARFPTPEGQLRFDPTALTTASISASFTIDVAEVDTDNDPRSASARDDYLKADEHPTIELSFAELRESRVDAAGQKVEIEADATLEFMGETLTLPVRGVLTRLNDAARERLGLPAGVEGYVLQANLTLEIPETPLAADSDSFDSSTIPIVTRLVLTLDASQDPSP